ncbi:MAG: SRPBCC family protein [Pedobacter sp.]|nr:SRPBCC family protein [Pedobacter sp.]MDQ8053232.1 SRPBCC family protein [Pedobacter sp.]
MNILLTILLIIAIIVVFLLFLALVTKAEYSIERELVIDRPQREVFDYIKLMRNQEEYSVWVMKDPTNKIKYTGTDGQIGFLCEWEGKKQAGKGEQEIIGVDEGRSTQIEIRFERPFKSVGQTEMSADSVGTDQTLVKWKMTGKNKFPMTLFNLVSDSLLGKDMEQSLMNIRRNLSGS